MITDVNRYDNMIIIFWEGREGVAGELLAIIQQIVNDVLSGPRHVIAGALYRLPGSIQ